MQTQTAIAPTATLGMLFHRIWPWAAIIFALGVNVAWVALLGYGFVNIIKFAF
jgi:hypothetical protein